MIAPLRFSPSVETPEPGEHDTQAQLAEAMLSISRQTLKDEKESLRSVHAKSHGILKGRLTVPDGLPATLAQGLFAQPGSYEILMRFSTSPGDLLPDTVSTPRGLAIKVLDVPGARLPDSEASTDQDFLLVTGEAFNAPDARHFLKTVKLLAATTDKAEGLKVALSVALHTAESALELAGGESATLKSLGGYPHTHILGESFFSQVPLRYGDYIAKVGVFPVSAELKALTGAELNFEDEFDALRQAVRSFFVGTGGSWELRVQLCTNLDDMPVEKANVKWPEKDSPYVTVARLDVEPQESWSDELRETVDKGMAFTPWNGLAAHQPLGSIMRVRKFVYQQAAGFRLSHGCCPTHSKGAAIS